MSARRWELREGDALRVLAKMPSASVDAVVTDPPYGISIGGEAWDGADLRARGQHPGDALEQFTERWATECRRVLRPGGHLLAFGAPRMFHRLVAGVEASGLEVRDQLLWLYGSGIPKSRRLPGGQGWSLKPAYEPILLARRAPDGTLAANHAAHGTGTLGIAAAAVNGRWPANLALAHTSRCTDDACSSDCPVALIDRPGGQPRSRIFYCAKPTRKEREAGLEQLPTDTRGLFSSIVRPRANVHPTVKPVDLMRWLIRLTVPEHGIVLDPFAGSGTTGLAALQEGRRFIGVERDGSYARIARARISHADTQPDEERVA